MFRISSLSVIICFILCSHWAASISTEELPTNIHGGGTGSQEDIAGLSLSHGLENVDAQSQAVHALLQQQVVGSAELAPSATTSNQITATLDTGGAGMPTATPPETQDTGGAGMSTATPPETQDTGGAGMPTATPPETQDTGGAGMPTATPPETQDTGGAGMPMATPPETQDTDIVEPTAPSLGLSSPSAQMVALPETEAQQNDVDTDQTQLEQPQGAALDSRQATMNAETAISTEADQVLSAVADTEPIKANYQPDISQMLEQIQHTQIDAADTESYTLPWSSEGNLHTFDAPVPTEPMSLDSPGTQEPTVVGKITVNPQVVDEVVVPTQFSLEDDDEKHNNGEEEFPTFDKWSMQYLAEQEKQKSEKKQEQVVSASTLLLQKKLRQNYAAASCGAKVVASNPEAENVQFLLNRNPDEYMISPCKAKKWFVVELCEPIQIHKVELGSLEMFSSPPKSFRAFASQRYPSKEWLPVGKYDMLPERSIQSFTSQPSEEFVKFVRVELLEHYGDEHYCPVSTFRVMGLDVTSDDDDETINEAEETDEESFGEIEDEDLEESVNLFTSAKEIVLKLVKKVLYQEDQQEERQDKSSAADNITVKAEEKKAKAASCSDQALPSHPEIPTVHIPEAGKVSPPPGPKLGEEMAIVTKLADTEQLPTVTIVTPVIIKLGEDADSRHWDFGVYDTPDHCINVDWSQFLHIMAYKHMLSTTCPASSQPVRPDQQLSDATDHGAGSRDTVGEDVTVAQAGAFEGGEVGHEAVAADTGVSLHTEASERSPGIREVDQGGRGQAGNQPLPVTSSQNGATVVPAHPQPTDSDESVPISESTSFTSSGVSVTRSEELEPSSLFTQPDIDAVTLSLMTPDLDLQQSQVVEQGTANLAQTIFLKVSPSPTLTSQDSMAADEDIRPEAPTAEHRTDLQVDEHKSRPPSDSSLKQSSEAHDEGPDLEAVAEQIQGQMSETNETSSSGGRTEKSVDLVKVGLSSASKRDTSIMKLSSRIMALEQNVSMAKKYLEELSRAFKQQNEDMMKLLNKTEKKLSVYVSQSEERELRQQTHTDVLEQKVDNLSQLVDTMQLQMNALGKELQDAQFLLAFVQAVLFVWLMIISVRGRGQSPLVYTDHQFLLDTMPTKPTFERSETGNLHRRSSDVGVQRGLQPGVSVLKRQVSEANLASIGGNKEPQGQFVPDTAQVPKKRKKKKLKQQQMSVDSVSSLSATSIIGSLPAQSSSFSSYAGVLFGTDSSYRPAQTLRVEECYRPAQDMLGNSSPSQALSGVRENHPCVTGCEPRPARMGWPCALAASNCLHTGATMSAVRIEETGSVVTAPRLVPPEPGFESRTGIQLRESQRAYELPGAADTCVAGAVLPASTSPEFHVPMYHRNKMRPLADNRSSNHSDLVGSKSTFFAKTYKPIKRRSSVGFINSQVGAECFLAENYMCENRFKFPSSLPLVECESASKRTAFVNDGATGESQYPALAACELKQPHSWALPTQPDHYSSTSVLSTLSSDSCSSRISSSKSLPQTPSVLPQHDTSQLPLMSATHNGHSWTSLASTSLAAPRTDHNHSARGTCQHTTQTRDTAPVLPLHQIQGGQNVAQCDVSSLMTCDIHHAIVAGVSTSAHTHKRQKSLPLHSLRPSKSSEKTAHGRQGSLDEKTAHGRQGSLDEKTGHGRQGSLDEKTAHGRQGSLDEKTGHGRQGSLDEKTGHGRQGSLDEKTGHGRQGSLDDDRLQGQLGPASLQSSYTMKKMASLSKKNSGSGVAGIDSCSRLSASKKGSI